MSKKKNALGRGLSAIFRNSDTDITSSNSRENSNSVGTISEILIADIQTNPFQPRNKFNEDGIRELASSIEELGVIQPITVRKLGCDKYQLISGERRLKASHIAGLTKIPTFIRIANDQQMLEMALVENIQRKDLNPIEISLGFKRLINECNLTQEACGKRIGKNRSTVTNFLRLLKLPEEIQLGLQQSRISMGHARALVSIPEKKKQLNIYYDAIANGFSVREIEQIVKIFAKHNYKRISKGTKINQPLPFFQQRKIHELSNYFDRDIELKRTKKGKGKLIIPFISDKDFANICSLIKLNP